MADTDVQEREEPPELQMPMPDCSVCGKTVDLVDDRFVCRRCGARWRTRSAFYEQGEWLDPSAPQCPSVSRFKDRCLLAEGHDPAVHRRDWDDWKDPDWEPR